jgi:hypothetical protein
MTGAMRLVFVVLRKNYYRVIGPVVDAALKRGWSVECWHDWDQPRSGAKGSEFPDAMPTFRWGTPKMVVYRGEDKLVTQLGARSPDAVIALGPRPVALPRTVRWVGLHSMTNYVHARDPLGVFNCDVVAGYSRFWLERAIEYFNDSGALRDGDERAKQEIERRFTVVGAPELDLAEAIEPKAVRERLGLPSDRPVVLYLPYPTMSNPRTFWLRHVYAPTGRVRRAIAVLAKRRFEYWRHVASDWNDRRLVAGLRAFCDANDAFLVVKSRHKEGRVPRYTRSCADLVLYDPSHYPATILELLSVASLCVHFFSSAVYESIFLGVPSLCIAPSAEDMGLPQWSRGLFNVREGESYNVPGASYFMPLPEAFDALRRARFKDFPMDPMSRADFVRKFLGFDDTHSSERVLELVAARGEQP